MKKIRRVKPEGVWHEGMEFLEGRDNRDLHVISSFYPDFYRELSRVMGSPAGG